jgi:hypothetical protein
MGNTVNKKKVCKLLDLKYYNQNCFEIYSNFANELKKISFEEFANIIRSNSIEDSFRIKYQGNLFRLFRLIEIEVEMKNNLYSHFVDSNERLISIVVTDSKISMIKTAEKNMIMPCHIMSQNIPLFLFRDNNTSVCNIGILIDGKLEYSKIFSIDRNTKSINFYCGDNIYNFQEMHVTMTRNNDNKIKNTFISFEDICRINRVPIPFFWKLNYLQAYKKLRETKEELFERNVFKTIIGYI